MIYTNRVKIAEQAYSSLSSEAQECLCKWAKEFGSNFPSGAGYTNRNESRQTVLKMICPCAYPEFPRRGKQTQASMESYNSEALASRSANVFWLMKDQILRYELKLANILRKNKFQENQHGIWECLSKEARLKYTSSWLNHKYRIVRSNGDLQIHQTRTKVISQSQSLCELSFIVTLKSTSTASDDQRKCALQLYRTKNTVKEYSCSCEQEFSTLQPCKHVILIMENNKYELEDPPKHILVEHYLKFCQVGL